MPKSKLRTLTASLMLTAGMVAVPAVTLTSTAHAQTQRAVLSGETVDLRWSVYGPGRLGEFSTAPGTLLVSAHPQATVTGATYQQDQQTIVMAFRAPADLRTVLDYHNQQLTSQGWNRTSVTVDQNEARAVYTKDNDRIELRLQRTEQLSNNRNAFRAQLNLSGIERGQGQAQGGQQQMQQQGQMQQGQMQGQMQQGQMQQQMGATLADVRGNNIRALVLQATPLSAIRPETGTVRLTVPRGSELVGVQRDKDGYEVAIGMRTTADPYELFEFYRRLMAAQGFVPVSLDYDVEDANDDEFDADHIEAVFARNPGAQGANLGDDLYAYSDVYGSRGDRIDFLIDREGPYSYVIYANPEGYAGATGYGVYDRPLYEGAYGGADYGYYGPIGYEGYAALPADRTRLRIVAPGDVRDFRLERRDASTFEYRFRSQQGVQPIYDFYNRLLTEQGFERQSGELGAEGGEFVYVQGDRRVLLDLDRVSRDLYAVAVDLEPRQ